MDRGRAFVPTIGRYEPHTNLMGGETDRGRAFVPTKALTNHKILGIIQVYVAYGLAL